MLNYKTKGTCATEINFEIEDNHIKEAHFIRGCEGNLKAISALVKGMNVDDAIERLKGIDCHGKGTSCPDQLAHALMEWKEQKLKSTK